MNDRTIHRLHDIVDAIEQIDILLADRSFADLHSDRISRAAFERFLEILSQASRHIPREIKETTRQTPWRRMGDLGNHLRHAYNRVDAEILWNLHAKGDLADLKAVVADLIGKLPPSPDP